MNGIIPILIIIFIIARISGGMKKVHGNRPGQHGAAPTPGGSPARNRAGMSGQTVVVPPGPVQPAQSRPIYDPATAPVEQKTAHLNGMLDESDRARDDLTEGDSRECDHGSVGGSMDITTHMGQGEAFEHARQQVQTRVKVNVKASRSATKEETSAAARPIPEMSAAQMRQAVIRAEILKRPAERFAGRRWAAR